MIKLDGLYPAAQTLDIIGYDPASADAEGRVKLRRTGSDLVLHRSDGGYVIADIKPGRYLIGRLVQQDFFFGCFQEATFAFEVKPNTVAMIGTYNPLTNTADMLAEAERTGKTTNRRNAPTSYFENMRAPDIKAASVEVVAKAEQYLQSNAQGITLPVEAVVLEPITFRPGRNAFGQKVCAVAVG